MKKNVSIILVTALVMGLSSFYLGMQYAQSQGVGTQSLRGANGNPSGGGFRGRGANDRGNGVAGEILSKDDKSVTLKLRDGGSSIVFFSDSTAITKSISGTKDDLVIGKTVFVSGDKNSDGSMNAKTIQLRPFDVSPNNSKPAN